MKKIIAVLLAVPFATLATEDHSTPKFDAQAADRFARLALACVGKEYPNKISHVLNSDADAAPPRKLTPAFCVVTTGILLSTGTGYSRDWRGRFRKPHSP